VVRVVNHDSEPPHHGLGKELWELDEDDVEEIFEDLQEGEGER
jgi:hypothetical protein